MNDSAAVSITPGTPPVVNRFEYIGLAKELFLLMLVNIFFNAITFGIYSFWAKTRTRKYIWSHIRFQNDRFEYTGTGKELFLSASKLSTLLIIFYLVVNFTVGQVLPFLAQVLPGLLFLVIIPFAQYSGRNYRLNRTRWRGIKMGMTKQRWEYVKIYFAWWFFSAMSVGLLSPLRWHHTTSFLINNTKVGSQQFRYTGNSKDIFVRYLFNWFLITISLGLYYPWHSAWIQKYKWRHTEFMTGKFKFVASGSDIFVLYLQNFVFAVGTLGLALPYLIHHNLLFYTERLALIGDLDFNTLQQAYNIGNADAEEIADFLDVDFGF